VPAGTDSEEAARLIEGKMSEGHSFVLAYEHVSAARRPMRWLSDGIFELTGLPASIHLYCSAKGAQVLKPHTDPYDVLVWQLVGSKSWRACVPREEMASGSFNVTVPLSDSQRCLLQELAKDNIEGCARRRPNLGHSRHSASSPSPRPHPAGARRTPSTTRRRSRAKTS